MKYTYIYIYIFHNVSFTFLKPTASNPFNILLKYVEKIKIIKTVEVRKQNQPPPKKTGAGAQKPTKITTLCEPAGPNAHKQLTRLDPARTHNLVEKHAIRPCFHTT